MVGRGFCNVGWTFSYYGLKRCIIESMDDAWEKYREDSQLVYDSHITEKYFTTEDDLKNFGHLEIYGIKIPRHIAIGVYFKTISDEMWNEFETKLRNTIVI